MRFVLLIVYIIFLIAPGTNSWLDGLPLDQLHEMVFLTALITLFLFLPIKKSGRLDAANLLLILLGVVLIIAKITIGQVALQSGLNGKYYLTESHSPVSIRLDKEINFKNFGYSFDAQPFPIWFFNNAFRMDPPTERRPALSFRAVWEGFIFIPKEFDEIGVFYNGDVRIYLNGILKLDSKKSRDDLLDIKSFLENGEKIIPVKIIYEAPPERNKLLKLTWGKNNNAPVDTFFANNYSLAQIKSHYYLVTADYLIKLLMLSLFIWSAFFLTRDAKWHHWLTSYSPYLLVLFFGVSFFVFYNHGGIPGEDFFFLRHGNDPIVYETYSRHLLFSGDWLIQEVEREPYYRQILYYYLLAIAHSIGGESLLSIFYIQLLSIPLVGLLIFYIAKLILDNNNSIRENWYLLLLLPIISFEPFANQQSMQMFPVGTFLLISTIFFLLLSSRAKIEINKNIFLIIAGLTWSLAILMRNNLIPGTILIIIWVLFVYRKKIFVVFVFLISTIIPLTPFIIRNKIVANQWRLTSRPYTTTNFILATPLPDNYIPEATYVPPLRHLIEKVFDPRAFPIIQWIIDQPMAYAQLLISKIGFYISWGSNWLTKDFWFLTLPCLLFIPASLVFVACPKFFSKNTRRTDYLITGAMALVLFLTIIITGVSERRLALPIWPLIITVAYLLVAKICCHIKTVVFGAYSVKVSKN